MVDSKDNTGTNYTITVPAAKLAFLGYNVIRGNVNGNWLVDTGNATDDVLDKDAASPLFYEDGIYKVVVDNGNGPAYKHLIANPTSAIEGVTFPTHDLTGTEINYAQLTHSGAWQVLYGDEPAETEYPTSINIAGARDGQEVLCNVQDEAKTLQLTASVLPRGSAQEVTWTSSDDDVATIDEEGNVIIPFIETPATSKEVTFTATTVALGENGEPVTASITLTVQPFVHVESVTLATHAIRGMVNSRYQLTYTLEPVFYPSNATNQSYTWEIEDIPDRVETYGNREDNRSIIGKDAGEVKVKFVAADRQVSDECTFTFFHPSYSGIDGAFLLTEGNYPSSGRLHFLYEPSGEWDYRIYSTVNNYNISGQTPRDLGITTQFGAIYGDKFFFSSKQEPRLVIADAVTLKQHKEFHQIYTENDRYNSLDGRAFLGVDENTGYLGTAGGICVVHFDELLGKPGDMSQNGSLVDVAVKELPYTLISGTHTGTGQYSGQVSTMLRVGDRVFAVQQGTGLLVINALTHRLETVIDDHYFSVLTQSFDGMLWAGATTKPSLDSSWGSGQEEDMDEPVRNVLLRINPYNLEIAEVELPGNVSGPRMSWGAWQADAFMGSAQKNQLYWAPSDRKTIVRYDIETATAETVFDAGVYSPPEEFAGAHYSLYGTSFGIHPVTDELYVWITLFHLAAPSVQRAVWEIHKVNPDAHTDITYPIQRDYLWPSMWIWQDNAGPEISSQLNSLALSAEKKISLRAMVTDYDNMDAAIVKSILPGYDASLLDVQIKRDSLFITPLTVPAYGSPRSTTLTLKVNSNGKVATKAMQITVRAEAIPVSGVRLDRSSTTLTVGQSLQLYASVEPYNADDSSVDWTSSFSSIASVSDDGWVTALTPGTTDITVTTRDGSFTATCTITTLPAPPDPVPVTGVRLDRASASLTVDQTLQLTATVEPYNADDTSVSWTSSRSSVASVSTSGRITALVPGTTDITVITRDGSFRATCTITVESDAVAVTGVRLDWTEAQLVVGQTLQLTATVDPADAENQAVRWSSSIPAIASVSDNGLVTALAAPASVDIIVTTVDGGFTATCTVTTLPVIGPEVNPFELTADKITIKPGAYYQLALTAPEHYPNVGWRSSHPEVATVTSSGRVEGVAHGIANIIAWDVDGTKADTCQVTVMAIEAPRDTIALSTTQLVMNVDETAHLSVVLVSESLKGQPVVWTTSDADVATVTDDGEVRAQGAGVILLTASIGKVQATCAVAVRDVAVNASVPSVETDAATITFPKMASASYYLIHAYEKVDDQRVRLITLKVNTAGEIVIAYASSRTPPANEIAIQLSYLKPDTPYEAEIEVVRERDNRTEIISRLPVAFRTAKRPTALDLPAADAARAMWSDGVLHTENLAGYDCQLLAVNGQLVKRFKVNASREAYAMPLPAGLYLLHAEREGVRKTFKVMVR